MQEFEKQKLELKRIAAASNETQYAVDPSSGAKVAIEPPPISEYADDCDVMCAYNARVNKLEIFDRAIVTPSVPVWVVGRRAPGGK